MLPSAPEVNYFIPFNLLEFNEKIDTNTNTTKETGTGRKIKIDHTSSSKNNSSSSSRNNGNNDYDSSNVLQFIGSPGAIIMNVPQSKNIPQKNNSKLNQKEDSGVGNQKSQNEKYENEWIQNDKYSTSLNLITNNGISNSNNNMNSSLIESVTTFEYCSVASRSGILGLSSSSSKECSFYNLNISAENVLHENLPPIRVKTHLKPNITVTSFSLSDIAVKLLSTGNNGNYEKDKNKHGNMDNERNSEKNRKKSNSSVLTGSSKDIIDRGNKFNFLLQNDRQSTATFHPKIEKNEKNEHDNLNENGNNYDNNFNNNFNISNNALALLGDSEGKIHFYILSKSVLLQNGVLSAHTSPVVAVMTTGKY